MSKFWLIIITVVVTIILFVGLKRVASGKKQVEQVPQLVRISEVEKSALTESVNAPGEIQAMTKVELSAKLSAKILDLPFDEGDSVKAGDIVVKLDDSDMQSSLLIAQANYHAQEAQFKVEESRIVGYKADLKTTEVQLEEAKRNHTRQKKLMLTKDISQAVYDTAELNVQRLEAACESAQSRIKTAELNLEVLKYNLKAGEAHIQQAQESLEYTVIKSPIDGVITRLNAEVGEVVVYGTMNNPGTIILEVADLSQMILLAQIDESDIADVKLGQKATLSIQAYPDREFTGIVDTIALKHRFSSSGVKYYETEILVDNVEGIRLYSGLTADVDIQTVRHDDVFVVLTQAILGRPLDGLPLEIREKDTNLNPDKTFAPVVYRYIEGKAIVTPVITGKSSQMETVIVSGLIEGEPVIIGPFKILESINHNDLVKDETEPALKDKDNTSEEKTAIAKKKVAIEKGSK